MHTSPIVRVRKASIQEVPQHHRPTEIPEYICASKSITLEFIRLIPKQLKSNTDSIIKNITMLSRTISKRITALSTTRSLHACGILSRKNDASTIDSYKLPSQTSILEWEFKYDFIPKVSGPRIPPVTKEAVQQDIASMKKASVEKEILRKQKASVKVEGNKASVVHGGEAVAEEPTYLQDKGTEPINAFHKNAPDQTKPKKPANRDKYIQSSINPQINETKVVNLGDNIVDHKNSEVEKQTRVVDDLEHDNLQNQSTDPKQNSETNWVLPLALLGAAGAGGYYIYTNTEKK